jgi:hypothetical protein
VNLQSVDELRYLLVFLCELKFARFFVASLEEAAEVGRIKIQEHTKRNSGEGALVLICIFSLLMFDRLGQ